MFCRLFKNYADDLADFKGAKRFLIAIFVFVIHVDQTLNLTFAALAALTAVGFCRYPGNRIGAVFNRLHNIDFRHVVADAQTSLRTLLQFVFPSSGLRHFNFQRKFKHQTLILLKSAL